MISDSYRFTLSGE